MPSSTARPENKRRAEPRVAVLGPTKGTYSSQAADHFFSGLDTVSVLCKSMEDVVAAVESGSVDYGVLPIENSSAGSVDPSLDALISSKLVILAAFNKRIEHALLARSQQRIEAVRTLYSLDQPYEQCRSYIRKHLPLVQWVRTTSTAEAVDRCLENPRDSAAIAAAETGRSRGLDVLRYRIQDLKHNFTHFALVGRRGMLNVAYKSRWSEIGRRATLAFTLENRPGKLVKVLEIFRRNGINMRHIESRPTRQGQWEYYFWVTLDCKGMEPLRLRTIIKEDVRAHTLWQHFFGIYPVLSPDEPLHPEPHAPNGHHRQLEVEQKLRRSARLRSQPAAGAAPVAPRPRGGRGAHAPGSGRGA